MIISGGAAMDRAEAYKTLRLDESADGQMVQTAYWMLVRQAQDRGRHDSKARWEIDRYNEAYAALAPDAQRYTPTGPRAEAPPAGTEILDRLVDWLSEEALRARARWAHRNPEIGVILGVTLFLTTVALGAGASFWLVMGSVLLIMGAIWAPWRRVTAGHPEGDDREPATHARPSAEP
jgi:hypothetical protein